MRIEYGVENGELTVIDANSWTCFLCRIDPKTGAILSATFTK